MNITLISDLLALADTFDPAAPCVEVGHGDGRARSRLVKQADGTGWVLYTGAVGEVMGMQRIRTTDPDVVVDALMMMVLTQAPIMRALLRDPCRRLAGLDALTPEDVTRLEPT